MTGGARLRFQPCMCTTYNPMHGCRGCGRLQNGIRSVHLRFLIGAKGGTRRCFGISHLICETGVRGEEIASSERAPERDELWKLSRTESFGTTCTSMHCLCGVFPGFKYESSREASSIACTCLHHMSSLNNLASCRTNISGDCALYINGEKSYTV